VSPRDFWMDHVRHHLVDRVLNYNARGLDMSAYPSVPRLWLEFLQHTGYLLLPLGTLALGLFSFTGPPAGEEGTSTSASSSGWRGMVGLWAIWALMIAVAFSVIDWRQTKHLAPLVLPLTLAISCAGRSRVTRLAFGLALCALLAWDVRVLWLLAKDFNSLPAVPEW
jgi:hypothetical protein